MRKQTLVLWPIVILSGALALAMLTKGHDWGDDFAAYIMQAAGILHGTVREAVAHTAFTMRESSRAYGPIAAPWGFPTLLAPFYLACGGLNIFCLKLINVPFFAFFLIAWSAFLTRRLSLFDSAIVLSILAFSPTLLSFQDNVLSEITFLFFSTLSVLLIDKVIVAPAKPEGSLGGNVWLGVVCFVAFSVRPNGILLVPTLFLTQALLCFRRRSPRPSWRRVLPIALIPHLVFGVLAVALLMTLPSGEASYLSHFKALTPGVLFDNVSAYAVVPIEFFDSVPFPLSIILCGALLPCLIGGAVLHCKDDFHALIYVGLTLLLYITWPLRDGLRYLFPLIPFLIYFAYRGMQAGALALTERYRRAGQLLTRAVWVAVVAIFALTSFRLARANLLNQRATDDGPFEPSSMEMFDVIKTRTAPDSVVLFLKPRAMRLMAGRDALLIDQCDQLGKGHYAVIQKKSGAVDQVRPEDITTCNKALDVTPIFENQQYVVYRILPKR